MNYHTRNNLEKISEVSFLNVRWSLSNGNVKTVKTSRFFFCAGVNSKKNKSK